MSQGFGEILLPPMGTMDMDSVPPATITSAEPERIRSAARAMACRPEEQKRLMVMALVSTGRPARREAMRATFMPCSPSGMAQPRITSSICLTSTAGTRASASLMASAARLLLASCGEIANDVTDEWWPVTRYWTPLPRFFGIGYPALTLRYAQG